MCDSEEEEELVGRDVGRLALARDLAVGDLEVSGCGRGVDVENLVFHALCFID